MIRSRSKEPPNDNPVPTPLSELNRLAKRQRKYHPARPYRWWEYKPMQAEPPEVFYPPREGLVDYTSRLRSRGRFHEDDFSSIVVGALLLAVLWGLPYAIIKLLFGGLLTVARPLPFPRHPAFCGDRGKPR